MTETASYEAQSPRSMLMIGLLLVFSIFTVLAAVFFLLPFIALKSAGQRIFLVVGLLDGLVLGSSGFGETIRLILVNAINGRDTNPAETNWTLGGIGVLALLIIAVVLYFSSGKLLVGAILGILAGICLAATGLGGGISGFLRSHVRTTALDAPHLVHGVVDTIGAHSGTALTALHLAVNTLM